MRNSSSPWLIQQAAARRLSRPDSVGSKSLVDFVPWASPELVAPHWLAPLADALEAGMSGPYEGWNTEPPRVGKTELIKHAFVLGLLRDPATRYFYGTHTAQFARKKSREIKKLARRCGVQIEHGADLADEWETTAGGGLVARGVGGEVTGRGFKLVVIDDPIKGRELADSFTWREKTWLWLLDDVQTRLEPDGALLLNHTRWHPDDPIGRAIEDGWQGTCLRAIAEPGDERPVGTPLAPELGWTLDKLEIIKRKSSRRWASLYQGRPRPRGGSVFEAPAFYTSLPQMMRVGHGVDLAYTAKTQADWSVCVTVGRDQDNKVHVLDMVRKQVEAPEFLLAMVACHAKRPGHMLFRGSGTEKGASAFIAKRLKSFRWQNTRGDKYVNAQEVAADWNIGNVLLPDPSSFPEAQEWVADLLDETDKFTGVDDAQDDIVDALGSAHAVLSQARSGYAEDAERRKRLPKRRM